MKKIALLGMFCLMALGLTAQNLNFRIAPEEPASAKAAGDKIHIVQKGETLYGIAQKYEVDLTTIKALNGMTSNSIQPNQRLLISKASIPAAAGAASPANARMAGANARMAGNANEAYDYYVVKKGDDIFSISDTKEVPVAQLKDWNPESAFQVGDRIVVGKKEMPAATASNARVASSSYRTAQPTGNLGSLGAANQRVASPGVPVPSSSTYRASSPALSQPQRPIASVTDKDGTVYEMPAFNIYGQVAVQARYGEVADSRVQSTRFYGHHKTLPLGTKINLLIPGNAGFIEVEIVGRLNPNSTADIALSPSCVEMLKGAGADGVVTITYN